MKVHGKKYRNAEKLRDITATYQPKQALEIVKSNAFAKFDETVEVAVRLGVDPRHADQIVRGTVVLPAGTGKTLRVLVIAVGDKARDAQEAGIEKGSGQPNRNKVGKVTKAQIRKIAEIKMPDLNCDSLESAMAMVAGAARSMGLEVVD